MSDYLLNDFITGLAVVTITFILIRLWIKKKKGIPLEYDPYEAQTWPLNGVPISLPALDKNNPDDQRKADLRLKLVWAMAIAFGLIGSTILLLLIAHLFNLI